MSKNHGHKDCGYSSFEFVNTDLLITELNIRKGLTFLDLGCGIGDYSILVSDIVSDTGKVFSVDIWEDGIEILKSRINSRKINNIEAFVSDISKKIPLDDNSVDICFMSIVFHGIVQNEQINGTIKELKRVLRPEGRFAVLEFKKIELPIGPPINEKLSSMEIERIITPYSFIVEKDVEIDYYHYLITFISKDR